MRPDLNANTSSSNPEIQRWYAEQRNHPAAAPEPAPVPQMRARSPQRLHQKIDLDTNDDSQADAHSDAADTRAAKRQREEEPGELEQMKPAKARRIEAQTNMQLVSRGEVLPTPEMDEATLQQQVNEAIRTGDPTFMKRLLSLERLELNLNNDFGVTLLGAAAEHGHLDIVETLLHRGAEPQWVDNYGQTPLLLAAANGHADVVNLLLKAGADIDDMDGDDWTALLFAADAGYLTIVHTLLDKGADLDQMGANGDTALMLAADNQHIDIVRLLLNNGASVNLCEGQNVNATEIAIKAGNLGLLELLLSHGGETYYKQNPAAPLVGDLLRHRRLLQPEVAIDVLAPNLQTGLQHLLNFALPPTEDTNTVIRQTLENTGVCSPIVQQLMQYFGDIPALWQTLAGTGQVASAAQKSLSIAGAFAQLDAWVKNWPQGYDPYQGQGLSDITAARCTALLKRQVAQLVAIAHDKEALILAEGINNLLPICVQHTQGDAQQGFVVNQQDLIQYLNQQHGLYGLLAEQVATAWINALTDQQSVLSALTSTQAVIDFDDALPDWHPLSHIPDSQIEPAQNQTLDSMLNDPVLEDTVEQSLLPAFARQLKLMDAANGHSLLRTTQTASINTDAYADLMYRQLHMLSQYWTQASAGSLA